MNRFLARLVFAVGLLSLAQATLAASVAVDKSTLQNLVALKPGQEQRIAQFPVGGAEIAGVRLKPVRIYADDARIVAMTAKGKQELPRSTRVFLRGVSDDGRSVVAISLERDGRFAEGTGNSAGGPFVLRAQADTAGAITLTASPLQSTLPPGFKFDFKCSDESLALTSADTSTVANQLHAAVSDKPAALAATAALRYATVAIDTDSLFMSRMFGNNTTSATNYIASLFNSMNTMYQNNLQVELLQGMTILRTNPATDPYADFNQSTGADSTKLNELANYWNTKETAVPRAFTALLSGATASTQNSCSASGYASINAYCDSRAYSVNQLCTSISIDPNGTKLNSRILGHEIGHNFGAFHTHCTNVSTAAAPVSTNTIDQCYNGEGGCYAGATACPADGHGTIMSYCNFGVCGSVQVNMQFHPTQITKLESLITTHTPSCVKTSIDEIFADDFEP
jgi:hypothetical protein